MCYTRRKIEGGVEALREDDDTNFLKPNGQSRNLNIYDYKLMHALQYFTLCYMYVVSMLNRSRAELRKTSQTPEPGHKNPRVQALSVKWRQVWLMTMDRRRRLQDALDLQKEVCVCLSIKMLIHEFHYSGYAPTITSAT